MEIIDFEKRDLINYKTEKFRMSYLVLGPGIYINRDIFDKKELTVPKQHVKSSKKLDSEMTISFHK